MFKISTLPSGLLTLTDCLLTQVEPGDAVGLAKVSNVDGAGMVLSGNKAIDVLGYLSDRGYRASLLADRQRYKGKRRCPATHPFDPDWIARQRRLQLPVILPDAGYVAEGDLDGLRSVLIRSAEIDRAVAPLALANWWLYGAGLRLLLGEIAENPVPLALIIEHGDDPMTALRILKGVLALLGAGVPVIPLRCDISSLGLIAHGAVAAAFGSQTSLRHLYPCRDSGGGGKRPESAVWPAGMALHYSDLLHDAAAATPTDPRWRCGCSVCLADDRLDRLGTALVEEVRQHNTAALLQLRHTLVARPAGADRKQLWSQWCADAIQEHDTVSSGAVVVTAPKALLNWRKV